MGREEEFVSFVSKISEHRCAHDGDCEQKPYDRQQDAELRDCVGTVSLHEADGAHDLYSVRRYEREGQRKKECEEEVVEGAACVIAKLEAKDLSDHSISPLLPALTRWK